MASISESLSARMAHRSLRAGARLAAKRVNLQVEGLEHLPRAGPGIIAARHYHHFYDGCVLFATVPRPLQILVALDWIQHSAGRRMMEGACKAAGWPIVLRSGRPGTPDDAATEQERRRYLLTATRETIAMLRDGGLLVVFPEGYPTIDPSYTPKTTEDAVLPFQSGFLRFAELAARDGRTRVPIIPGGFEYDREQGDQRGRRWRIVLRFGRPLVIAPGEDRDDAARAVEAQVRELSGLPAT